MIMLSEKKKGEALVIEDVLSNPDFSGVVSYGWGVQSYWLKSEIDEKDERPIVICGQVFSNVPQPTVWNLFRGNPGFAVSYITGETRVMSIEEFNNFDFSGYIYVHEDTQ